MNASESWWLVRTGAGVTVNGLPSFQTEPILAVGSGECLIVTKDMHSSIFASMQIEWIVKTINKGGTTAPVLCDGGLFVFLNIK